MASRITQAVPGQLFIVRNPGTVRFYFIVDSSQNSSLLRTPSGLKKRVHFMEVFTLE